jgi:hypothetical protein
MLCKKRARWLPPSEPNERRQSKRRMMRPPKLRWRSPGAKVQNMLRTRHRCNLLPTWLSVTRPPERLKRLHPKLPLKERRARMLKKPYKGRLL